MEKKYLLCFSQNSIWFKQHNPAPKATINNSIILIRPTRKTIPKKSIDEKNTNISNKEVQKEYTMSSRTRQKISKRIIAYSYINNHNLSFFTFTLTSPAIQNHQEYNKQLNLLFTKIKRRYGKIQYLWVSELQNGKRNNYKNSTGNIHYHVIFDRNLPIDWVNYQWCLQLKKLGHKVVLPVKKLDGFYNSKGASNPVDVKRINDLKGLRYYVSKYISKNDSVMTAQIWNCSKLFSNLYTKVKTMVYFEDIMSVIKSQKQILPKLKLNRIKVEINPTIKNIINKSNTSFNLYKFPILDSTKNAITNIYQSIINYKNYLLCELFQNLESSYKNQKQTNYTKQLSTMLQNLHTTEMHVSMI